MSARTTTLLLVAIAAGLWLNVAVRLAESPLAAQSQLDLARLESIAQTMDNRLNSVALELGSMQAHVRAVQHSVESLANGSCRNKTLCE
jgi:hypothetical protein